jgi:5'-methylthioadenosine phosphorylase
MTEWVLGVIGGSGLYEIAGLADREWRRIDSPWGAPSDEILFGTLEGVPVRFLPRHGRGHKVSPSHINYRANIDALKRAGCTDILSLFAREKSFFGEGAVAHVSMAHPVCERLTAMAAAAAREAGATITEGGTYLCMEGPQFSTKAESELYRNWGCAVIGMTNMPEAKLAREAELPYASLAMVTDFDCWHEDHGHVEVADIIRVRHANAEAAKATVVRLAAALARTPRTPSPIDTGLDTALITPPEHRDISLMAKLDAVAARVLAAKPANS